MGKEFFINSTALQDKITSLLPSQGGSGAGVDLSASTQIIPVVDLTEQAEGSNVRADLQTALSFATSTPYSVSNTTTTIISNTGYFRVFGQYIQSGANICAFQLSDGATTKNIWAGIGVAGTDNFTMYDFNVFLKAGDSFIGFSNSTAGTISGSTRQIADIDGNLIDP